MLKVHSISSTLKPSDLVGTRKAVMPPPSPALPLVRAKIRSCLALWMPVFQVFAAVDAPAAAVADRCRLHVRGVGPVLRLGDAEREAHAAFEQTVNPLLLLLVRAVGQHQQHADIVGDDGVLGLQIVVQAETFGREVLADDRHREIAAVLAAVLLRQRIAIVAGLVGGAARLAAAAPPILHSAGRPGPSPCGRPRAGDRRSGCCRPGSRAA